MNPGLEVFELIRIDRAATVFLCLMILAGCDLFKSKKDPKAPSNLTAEAASISSLILSWTDNSSDEDGFVIEQRQTGSESFSQIGEVDENVTQFTPTGVLPSISYYYRVYSHNSDGNSKRSNTVNFKIYGTDVGHIAADLTLKDQNNQDYSLHSNTDKVILLNFSAEW